MQDRSLLAIFNEAVDCKDPVERARLLDETCGSDRELRQRVEKLLDAHERAGGFLSHPSEPPLGDNVIGASASQEKSGDRIGRYRLLEQIGEGGCGVVYMAEQEEPVRRRVALKVIKLGMDTRQVIARFEAERQALALMDHPNIAKVFDAGSTGSSDSQLSTPNSQLPQGRPFFVMELVRGVKITEFCDQHRLSPQARLRLFVDVCSAIQHAHQKGIIHRDLKPSNILVTMIDGAPVPKVIDFGIAKATTNQRLTDKTLFTAFEQFIGTPAYMSPEQAEMTGVDIDTRTDIYSLGVVLYELLTGKTPFDSQELLRSGIDEIRRTIRETEPPRPSTRLHALKQAEITTVAQVRQTQPPKLIHLIQGDLDWVVMKCLEKDRGRRYETPNALAADINRHLGNEPVFARPPSALYKFQKLVARHQAVSVLSSTLLLLLCIGAIMLVRSHRELRKALGMEQRLRAVEVESLHSSLLAQARAFRLSRRRGQRFDVLSILERAAKIRPTLQIRNEAAAALALPDFRPVSEWPAFFANNNATMAFSPALHTFVTGISDGGFALYATNDRRELRRFPSAQRLRAIHFNFSPGGQRLAVTFENGSVELWDLNAATPDFKWVGEQWPVSVDFSSDGKTLVVSDFGGLFLQPLETNSMARQPIGEFPGPPQQIQSLRFDPSAKRIAFIRGQTVQVWSCVNNTQAWSIELQQPTGEVAWSPDGLLLAVASDQDRNISLLDGLTGKLVLTLRGHQLGPRHLRFHPDGRRLVSVGWDRTLRYWDIRSGTELFSLSAGTRVLQFSADGRQLAYSPGYSTVGVLEIAPDNIFREFRATESRSETAYGINASPDGRFVATTTSAGLRIFDVRAGAELLFHRRNDLYWAKVQFPPDMKRILVNVRRKGILEFPFHWQDRGESQPAQVQLGEPSQVGADTNAVLDSLGYDNRSWVVTYGRTGPVELWPDGAFDKARIIAGGEPVTSAILSPDLRWAVSETYPAADIRLWDARTGQTTGTLGLGRIAQAAFSPDGRWLMTSTDVEYRLWQVGSWKPGPAWPADLTGRPYGSMKFPLESRHVVVEQGGDTYQLLRIGDALEELLAITAPRPLYRSSTALDSKGDTFYILNVRGQVFAWDLTQLRRELRALGLDWKD